MFESLTDRFDGILTRLRGRGRLSEADVDEVLRAAIDVRRLNKEIAAFVDAPAEIAILYSQTSTLQLPAEMLTWRTTPYLVELRRAYEASRTIDAKVTFVTERQAVRGALARYRLLLIPGVRNIPPEVVKAIGDYVAAGGHALILPESLLGDEYNRPQPFLAQFGVAVRSTERPRADESGRMVQGYDQSFAHDVAFSGGASGTLEPASPAFVATGALMSAGVRQTIEPAAGDQILYRYPDGRPAIVRAHVGNGVADYAAASLAEAGYARLLDKLAGEAGVSRPVRVRLDGAPGQRVEVRFARLGERRLLFLFNANSKPMRARVESNEGRVTSLTELRGGQGSLSAANCQRSSQAYTSCSVTYTAPAGTAVSAKNSQVRQGMLESSNVNPVTSVVEMITAEREVETMRRVLTMFSTELDKTAVQDLPRVS